MNAIGSKRDAIPCPGGGCYEPKVKNFELMRMQAMNRLLTMQGFKPLNHVSLAVVASSVPPFPINVAAKRQVMLAALIGEALTRDALTKIDVIDMKRLLRGEPFLPGELSHLRNVPWIRHVINILEAEESIAGIEAVRDPPRL